MKIFSVERIYIIQRPRDYDSSLIYPVVFAFHGRGGRASSWSHLLAPIIEQHKFIGVYPEGYRDPEAKDKRGRPSRTSWNLGEEESTADDILFIENLFKKSKYLIPKVSMRFAIGSSNGAGFLNFLVSNSKEKIFSGIGTTVSGLIKSDLKGRKKVTMPVSGKTYHYGISFLTKPLNIVAISGMNDPIIPYCGGTSVVGYRMFSAEDSLRSWAEVAGCSESKTKKAKLFYTGRDKIVDLSLY